jgi:hypothetical protein
MMTDVEMTDDEVRQQIERADCFIEQLRDAITARLSILRACAPTISVAGFNGSLTRWTRCLT